MSTFIKCPTCGAYRCMSYSVFPGEQVPGRDELWCRCPMVHHCYWCLGKVAEGEDRSAPAGWFYVIAHRGAGDWDEAEFCSFACLEKFASTP